MRICDNDGPLPVGVRAVPGNGVNVGGGDLATEHEVKRPRREYQEDGCIEVETPEWTELCRGTGQSRAHCLDLDTHAGRCRDVVRLGRVRLKHTAASAKNDLFRYVTQRFVTRADKASPFEFGNDTSLEPEK
ncbi:hypothetical protein IOD13_04675 [Brevibacterium casei]|nr:hypothetical protein [Brevibacterium casei]